MPRPTLRRSNGAASCWLNTLTPNLHTVSPVAQRHLRLQAHFSSCTAIPYNLIVMGVENTSPALFLMSNAGEVFACPPPISCTAGFFLKS